MSKMDEFRNDLENIFILRDIIKGEYKTLSCLSISDILAWVQAERHNDILFNQQEERLDNE